MPTTEELDLVFGTSSIGSNPIERSKNSDKSWYRNQDTLMIAPQKYDDLKLNAREVLEIFDFEVLLDCAQTGSVRISRPCEPMHSFIRVRKRLGLSQYNVARRANTYLVDIMDAENTCTKTPMKYLIMVCEVLGLDPRRISFEPFE